jgi:diguanylate cyclase (GGDEF)-like protein
VGIADIDWFKKVNDTYGHAAGDVVLRSVAHTIQQALRAGDLVGRIGGEEFGLLLPHATTAQAAATIERVRATIANNAVVVAPDLKIHVSISTGLAILNVDSTLEATLANADAALYQAKLTGRNRIVVAQSA